MKSTWFAALAFTLALCYWTEADGAGRATSNRRGVPDGSAKITLELLEKLWEENEEGNIFFSPASLSATVGMLYLGAVGKTAGQMRRAFYFPKNERRLCKRMQRLSKTLKNTKNVTVEMANKVFLMEDFVPLDAYQEKLRKCFRSTSQTVDFSDTQSAANQINSWVEGATHKKISSLITPDMIGELTRLVVVNGVYFKGDWAIPFPSHQTRISEFYTDDVTTVSGVSMMELEAPFYFAEVSELDGQVLEMPFKNKKIRMLVILPRLKTGLKKTITTLKNKSLNQIRSQLIETSVKVQFPRFKLDSDMSLINPLKKMGITDMFLNRADLSKISGSRDLVVSEIVQKASIEVNEKGSEAAAATGGTVQWRSSRVDLAPVFRADHPFLFFILDIKLQVVLFAGKVQNPAP